MCAVRPLGRILTIHLLPFFSFGVGIGNNGICGAFRLADTAVNAFIRIDHKHVFALIEAIDRANFNTVHVFAANTGFRDNIRHAINLLKKKDKAPSDVDIKEGFD